MKTELLHAFAELLGLLVFDAGGDDGVVAVLFLLHAVRVGGREGAAGEAAVDLVGVDVVAVLLEEVGDHAAFGLGLRRVVLVQDVDVRRVADHVHRGHVPDEQRAAEVEDFAAHAARLDARGVSALGLVEEFVVPDDLDGVERVRDVDEPADEQDVHESHADGH